MRLTFTIEFTREDPEPERDSQLDSLVELGPPTTGFAHPMHQNPYDDRNSR